MRQPTSTRRDYNSTKSNQVNTPITTAEKGRFTRLVLLRIPLVSQPTQNKQRKLDRNIIDSGFRVRVRLRVRLRQPILFLYDNLAPTSSDRASVT